MVVVKQQLTLRFGWGDGISFANYYSAGNEAAIDCVQQAVAGNTEQFVYLWGAQGSGKSHVLQAACQQVAEAGNAVAYLPLREFTAFGVEVLDGLESLSLVCIDDLQEVAGNLDWEEAIFHFYNRMRETQNTLLVAATVSPSVLPVDLTDLQSRLSWGPVFQLGELDDAGKVAALSLRASARGFDLPEEVALFLLRRSSRDMESLFTLLDKLDNESLAQHRKLTIPFVKSLI